MGATGLPIIVAVTAIGVSAGVLPSAPAAALVAALVAAGMLSVLLFPLLAMTIRRERVDAAAAAVDERL